MKAIIFSHENGGSYVMEKEGAFRFVTGYSSHPIGAEVDIRPAYSVNNIMRIAAAAACFIIIASISIYAWMWNSINYYIYMDINPSVEMHVNKFNKLKTINPLNEDGGVLLEGLKPGGSAESFVVSLIQEAVQKGYLAAVDTAGGGAGDAAQTVPTVFIMVIPTGNRSAEPFIGAIVKSAVAEASA